MKQYRHPAPSAQRQSTASTSTTVGHGHWPSSERTEQEATDAARASGAHLSKCHPDGKAAIHGIGTERHRNLSRATLRQIADARWRQVFQSIPQGGEIWQEGFRCHLPVGAKDAALSWWDRGGLLVLGGKAWL